jgi:hypothetical protein
MRPIWSRQTHWRGINRAIPHSQISPVIARAIHWQRARGHKGPPLDTLAISVIIACLAMKNRPILQKERVACRICGREFEAWKCSKRKYCSNKCVGTASHQDAPGRCFALTCAECGVHFGVYPSRAKTVKFCCRLCQNRHQARKYRELIGRSRRGTGKPTSYTKFCGRHAHRVVAEQAIKRQLSPDEVVHHIDGNRRNNRPENLAVMLRSEHSRLHSLKNRRCTVDGCGRKHAAR